MTLVALATSMFWFPKPARVDPQVAAFLAAEREAVVGHWTLAKVLMLASIPLFFLALGAAFWHRAWWIGVLVLGVGALQGRLELLDRRRLGTDARAPGDVRLRRDCARRRVGQ